MSESVNSGLHFDLDKIEEEKKQLEAIFEGEDFWNDRENALKVIARLNYCRDLIEKYNYIVQTCQDLLDIVDLDDESLLEEASLSVEQLKKDLKEFEDHFKLFYFYLVDLQIGNLYCVIIYGSWENWW